MTMSIEATNRLGFGVLGLTNNFAFVVMLSAAYDLLDTTKSGASVNMNQNNTTNTTQKPYCNAHSTSTILLADTIPSLVTKLLYPFLLVTIPNLYKASAVALLSAASFITTGLFKEQFFIFLGVISASLSSGLGECVYLSSTTQYGDASLSGWSMGTGMAGLLGSMAYGLLRLILEIEMIMLVMLVVPVAMMFSYLFVIQPIVQAEPSQSGVSSNEIFTVNPFSAQTETIEEQSLSIGTSQQTRYGINENNVHTDMSEKQLLKTSTEFGFKAKLLYLPSLAKYFLPLLLVYFAEYFINQGLFELIYYPEISFLDHATQYIWFQVTYQLGVFFSRSSLEIIRIKNLWAMAILQAVNAVLFLAHTSKLIHIPSFYIVILIISYEGLLGGFTYVNTFYQVKKNVVPDKQSFSISAVTMADSLGIVIAGFSAIPVHDSLCKLYV